MQSVTKHHSAKLNRLSLGKMDYTLHNIYINPSGLIWRDFLFTPSRYPFIFCLIADSRYIFFWSSNVLHFTYLTHINDIHWDYLHICDTRTHRENMAIKTHFVIILIKMSIVQKNKKIYILFVYHIY